MKTRSSLRPMILLGLTLVSPGITPILFAQPTAPTAPPPAPANQAAPLQLPADVWDVVRLAHSNVGDATILAYIKNSGKVYSLGVNEILYLREQGVSDPVIAAMLQQRNNSPVQVQAPAPTAPAPSVWANPTPEAAPQYAPPGQDQTVTSAPTVVQTAPVYTPPAPVYVYPSYAYDPYPYYGYPAVSLSFGWGGYYGYHGGYYHGGWGHSGGGYHGGGGGHGGGGHH